MNGLKIVGVVLVIVGLLALLYGGFTYTKETHTAELGPLEFRVEEKERVNIPLWAGVASVVVGAGILLLGAKK